MESHIPAQIARNLICVGLVSAHSSNNRCQSRFDRASCETSSAKAAPTWPIETSATNVLKSSRLVIRAPDFPRSRSKTGTDGSLQPSSKAFCQSAYWRYVLSR
jgi:hypothetical protein